MNNIWILAQAPGQEEPSGITGEPVTTEETTTSTVASDPNATTTLQRKGLFGDYNWIFFGFIFIMFYFLIFRGPRKKQQKHRQMVASLEKNDKVRTIGGIIGTVVDVKDDEITLKIDESNNTKIKVAVSAIGKNISKEKS